MSDEEKKAIEKIKSFNQYNWEMNNLKEKEFAKPYFDALDTILNLIEKQQKEIEKKDKIIDLMAEQLAGLKNEVDILEQGNKDCFIPKEYSDIDDCVKKESCKECIIEYFIKKVEEQKNGRN